MKYLCIIQARLGSTRFPNKVMQTIEGVPMVKRVWDAARRCHLIDKVVVAWPERYPNVDENNVLQRFRNLVSEYKPHYVIRLTADCPLLHYSDLYAAIEEFEHGDRRYYSNHYDGHDVQIFNPWNCSVPFHNEHVLADFSTESTGLSVNTKEDLERVRKLCKIK